MNRFGDIIPGAAAPESTAPAAAYDSTVVVVPSEQEFVLDPAMADPEQMNAFVSAVMGELQKREEQIAALERRIEEQRTAGARGSIAEHVGAEVTSILRAAEGAAEQMRAHAEREAEALGARVLAVVAAIQRAQASLGEMAGELGRSVGIHQEAPAAPAPPLATPQMMGPNGTESAA